MNRIWSAGRDRLRRGRLRPAAVRLRRRSAAAGGLWAKVLVRAAQAGVAVVALAGAGWGAVAAYRYVVETPALAVEEVRVLGVRAVGAEEIARLAGVRRGAPILGVDLAAVDARVEGHPRIASAVVRRLMPRAIEIEVVERTPAALANRAGEVVGLDPDGVLVPVYHERERLRLPIVTGVLFERTPLGGRVADEGVGEALRCLAALTPGLRAAVSEVRVVEDGGVSLVLSGSGTLVRMGRGGFGEKVRRLEAALDHFATTGERKEYIDVRFDDVVTRP